MQCAGIPVRVFLGAGYSIVIYECNKVVDRFDFLTKSSYHFLEIFVHGCKQFVLYTVTVFNFNPHYAIGITGSFGFHIVWILWIKTGAYKGKNPLISS